MKNKHIPLITFLEIVSWILLGVFGVFLFYRPVETGDIWWHLKVGEFIFQKGIVPLIDPFPFANEKSVWVLTQWLGSLSYYSVYHFTGLTGLKIFRLFVFGVTIYVFVRYALKRMPSIFVLFLTLLFIMALSHRPYLRPFVFNYLFIQVFLISLFNFSSNRKILSLTPIMIASPIWINLHLGSFMYGLSIIGLFLFSALVDLIKSRQLQSEERQFAWQLAAGYFLAIVVFVISLMFNPYGVNGALHPIRTLLFDDYLNFGHIKATISELQPPDLFSINYNWFWGVFCLGCYAIYLDRINRFRNLILFLCSFFMFLYGQRAGIFFALISFYIFIDSFKNVDFEKFSVLNKIRVLLIFLYLGCLTVLIQAEAQKRMFVDGKMYSTVNLSEDYTSPAALLNELKLRNIQGAVFNDDSYGGYLLWHNYPQIRPFCDTRQINVKNFKLYNLVLSAPDRYWYQVDLFNDFKAVLLDANKLVNRKAINFFLKNPLWSLLLVKGDKVLFVRKNSQTEYYEKSLKSQNENEARYIQILHSTLSAPPVHKINYIYMEPVATAITLYELGFKGAALEKLVYSFKISNSTHQHEMTRLILEDLNR